MARASVCCLAVVPTLLVGLLVKCAEQSDGGQPQYGKKHIVTQGPEGLACGQAESVGPDIVEGIRRTTSQDGPDLILSGSSTLTSPLLEHGLADEVLLIVYPVLLGTGKRIFAEGSPPRFFELVSAKAFASGIILSTHRPNGPFAQHGQIGASRLSKIMEKTEDSNGKANLRDQHDPGWLR